MKKIKINSLITTTSSNISDNIFIQTTEGLRIIPAYLLKESLLRNAFISELIDIFNPEIWEVGFWNTSNGAKVNTPGYLRTKRGIQMKPGKTYRISESTGIFIQITAWKSNEIFLSLLVNRNAGVTESRDFTIPVDAKYIKLQVYNVSASDLSAKDFKIIEL